MKNPRLLTFWQTLGRLRLRFNQFIQRGRDCSNRFCWVLRLRNDYALYEAPGISLTPRGLSVPLYVTVPCPYYVCINFRKISFRS